MPPNYKRNERVTNAQSVATLAARRTGTKAQAVSDRRSAYRRRMDETLAVTQRSPLGREVR